MESEQTANIEGADSRSGAARPEWFERLWADSHARIYNLAARIVDNRDDAADITQEVFLRAFTHPPDEKGLRDPQPWLYRVAVNACYDHLRRRAVRPTAPLEAAGELASATDGFAAAEMTRAVETALGSLTPRYRTALVLKDLHGLDTVEIAGAMEVTSATARVLLHRSRAAFRKAFREAVPAGGAIPVAGLAAYLPTLSVPQALQMPPSLAGLAPIAAAAVPVAAPAAAVPAAGVLAKISGALGVKAAAIVATVALATGGAAAVHELTPVVHDVGGFQSETSAIQAPARGGGADQGHGLSQGSPLMGSPQGQRDQTARRQLGADAGRWGSGPRASADAAGPGPKPSGQSDAQGGANADTSPSGGASSDTGSGNAGGAATGGSGNSSAPGSSSGGAGTGSTGTGSTGAGGSGGPGGAGSDSGEPSGGSR